LNSQPRTRHYQLAHNILRLHCDADPVAFFNVLESSFQEEFVRDIWSLVCNIYPQDDSNNINIAEFDICPINIAERRSLLVTMPKAKAVAEAIYFYFVTVDNVIENK